MSALIFGENILFTASKNAGTTIRRWVINALSTHIVMRHGEGKRPKATQTQLDGLAARLPTALAERVLNQSGGSVEQVWESLEEFRLSYHFGFFAPVDLQNRYCITRDPVSRFVSCVSQKLGKEKFAAFRDVQDLIDNFESLCVEPFRQIEPVFSFNKRIEDWEKLVVARHFAPQHLSFGDDRSYYTTCFQINEVNSSARLLLEDHFGQKIPPLSTNIGKKKIELTPGQVDSVRHLYRRDYACGYGQTACD